MAQLPLSPLNLNLTITSALSEKDPALGVKISADGVELPQSLGLLAESIGARNAEHLLTALQEFPTAFEAILNLPHERFVEARALLMQRLEELLQERARLERTTLRRRPLARAG